MATSFMSNLRRMKPLGEWAPTGDIRAGESDPYNWGRDLIERDRRAEMANPDPIPMRRGNMGRVSAGMSNPDWLDAAGSNGKMDVVYDQRPEMFQKQLNFQKDQAAQAQKNLEQKRIVDALAANDDYIQQRRDNERKDREFETRDWSARNLKPGEMGDREKIQIDYNNRHALETARAINDWVKQREANAGAERVANIRGDNSNETANIRANASTEAANIRAAAMEEAARIRAAASGNTENVPAPVVSNNPQSEAEKFKANAAELQGFMGDDELRKRLAQQKFGANNVPLVSGLGSGSLGGTPGSPGLRGNAPIDLNATATPYAANASNTPAFQGGGGQVMRKTQRNAKTGATRTVVSRDGGKSWQPE